MSIFDLLHVVKSGPCEGLVLFISHKLVFIYQNYFHKCIKYNRFCNITNKRDTEFRKANLTDMLLGYSVMHHNMYQITLDSVHYAPVYLPVLYIKKSSNSLSYNNFVFIKSRLIDYTINYSFCTSLPNDFTDSFKARIIHQYKRVFEDYYLQRYKIKIIYSTISHKINKSFY